MSNMNSGGYDISSLTRRAANNPMSHHLPHASAFGAHQSPHSIPPQQSLGHQAHPLLLPNIGLTNPVMTAGPVMGGHHPHSSSVQSIHHPHGHHLQSSGPSHPTSYHLPHHGIHQPSPQMAIHPASTSIHAHPSHMSPLLPSSLHQTPPVQPTPVSVVAAVSPAPAPVMSDATNAFASSVNLSSIQSLVDILVELPVPAEAPEVSLMKSKLITDGQQSTLSLSSDLQPALCQVLAATLQNGKVQFSQTNVSFPRDSSTSANSNQSHSQLHIKNAFLLSLLRPADVFSHEAMIPPPPASSGPQTRQSSQQQYWNPWAESQGQNEGQSNPPQQTQIPSPYVTSPAPPATQSYPSRQSSAATSVATSITQSQGYNDSSNSSSSFIEPSTPSSVNNDVGHRYQQQQAVHQQTQHLPQPSQAMTPHGQPQQLSANEPHLVLNNAPYQAVEPVIMIEKDEALEHHLQEYYAKQQQNGPDSCVPSLADRIKGNKRQRSDSQTREPKGKERKSPASSASSSPVKKAKASSTPTKSTGPSGPISSTYLSSSTTRQLTCLSESLVADEKFERMLDELFDLGKVASAKHKSRDSSEEDEEDSHNKKPRTNGDSTPALFDITLTPETLYHFVAVTAKLKRNNKMKSAPTSKITTLLTALTQQLTVQSAGLKRRKSVDEQNDSDDDEDSNITTSTQLLHKFESCCDCSVVALNILSSKGMSSRVYLEECIEQVIAFLNTTIQQFTTIGAAASSSPSKGKSKSPKKATNHYVSPSVGANKKILAKMYTKWSELIGLLVELLTLRARSLTDTLVLSTTRLALGAFFLENLSSNSSISSFSSAGSSNEIQLNALKLTTTIFAQYPGHRGVILDELLSSIARLPTSKRGRVIYKVDGEDGSASISMFSALLQELIQSLFLQKVKDEREEDKDSKDRKVKDLAQSLKQQYDAALKVAFTFLSTFLRKCCGLSVGGQAVVVSDGDFRVLFEGLVSDLMTTLHKPNWPASQLLTQVLVKILITNIADKQAHKPKGPGGTGGVSAQLNLKLASIEHLGTICSRFAKELSDVESVKNDVKVCLNAILSGDAVSSQKGKASKNDDDDTEPGSDAEGEDDAHNKLMKKKRKRSLRKIMDFLESDDKLIREIWKHLIRFCDEGNLAQNKNLLVSIWLREMDRELEQSKDQEGAVESNGVINRTQEEQLEARVKAFMTLYQTASNPNFEDDEYYVIDSRTAELIIRYLDISQSTTVKLFDSALGHVIAALSNTSNTTIRSRAMKALSNILSNAKRENATALLARGDLQRAMKSALSDTSTSVREATIDLIGKFILSGQSQDLIDRYYDILTDRVLDTGVSVRKRVIKILREICMMYPSYSRVPEICSKIIKRVNDDGEGIRKLVTETFTTMWFKVEKDREAIRLKVACINHVVATVLTDRIGTEWLQQLLTNLFAAQNDVNKKKTITELEEEEDRTPLSAQQLQQVKSASAQIIDVLVSEVLCGDHSQESTQQRKHSILSGITTLWLFGRVCPQLLLDHVSTFQPFLSNKCATQMDIMILSKVVQLLELVLPKLSNPSESDLLAIERHLTQNILTNAASVIGVCVSCLATVINKHSNNRRLAQEMFDRFFEILRRYSQDPSVISRPNLLRALYTCGLFAKHFKFLEHKEELFRVLIKFVRETQAPEGGKEGRDSEVLSKSLTGLGFMFERNPKFTMRPETQDIYKGMLILPSHVSTEYIKLVQCQVLKNLTNYLSDEFNNELHNQVNWSKEDLKCMESEEGDNNSIQSEIIQCYLADVLRCTLSPFLSVRQAAVNLAHIIHNGGHVHPLQLVPYLIAMSSDDDYNIRLRADHVLNEIERKYHGYVSMKSKVGIFLSYQLHSHTGRRGYRIENISLAAPIASASSGNSPAASVEDKHVTGRLATLYSVVAANRQSRRAFITGLLKYFDMVNGLCGFNDVMTGTSVGEGAFSEDPGLIQQFVCDNIVWLPYSFWDEPLYILTQIDVNTSILASNIQSHFKEILNLTEDDEDALDGKDPQPSSTPDGMTEEPSAEVAAAAGRAEETSNGHNFHSDLRAYLPKPIPSALAVAELVKNLKAYYMLAWSKHLIRELYSITDLKSQDYSPNENQKVWDKPVHRKTFDVRNMDRLMSYPKILINLDNFDEHIRDHIIAEYKRFKDVQLTGDQMSRYVSQILREPFGRAPMKDFSQMRDIAAPEVGVAVPSLPKEKIDELIQRIRANECSVSLENMSSLDIKTIMNSGPPNAAANSLKMTISVNSTGNKKKKKKRDKKKKKKNKHKRQSDQDSDSFTESESDDDDEDPDY